MSSWKLAEEVAHEVQGVHYLIFGLWYIIHRGIHPAASCSVAKHTLMSHPWTHDIQHEGKALRGKDFRLPALPGVWHQRGLCCMGSVHDLDA